jgi:hypothetical protein
MTALQAFGEAAATWQNFYLLVGGAAATLVGLMFVAVTFGANLVTPETSTTARSFLDPTFAHFVQVLFTACLIEIPTMTPLLLGIGLLGMAALRSVNLVGILRNMREASRRHRDVEWSDWVSGGIVPALVYLTVATSGVAFILGSSVAFTILVIATIVILMNGILGAWELMVWMAVARSRTKTSSSESERELDAS